MIHVEQYSHEIFWFVYAAILIFLIGHVMLKDKFKCMIKEKHIFFYEGIYLNKIPSLQSNKNVKLFIWIKKYERFYSPKRIKTYGNKFICQYKMIGVCL